MTQPSTAARMEQARAVADAILYEGYLLYPYRRSAQKNQTRFQFGVLVPPAYQAVDECERTASQTECLLEGPDETEILVLVRFLQLQRRIVQAVVPGPGAPDPGELHDVDLLEVDGTEYTPWDEAAERQQRASTSIGGLLRQDRRLEFHIGSGERAEDITDAEGRLAGRLIRRWSALDGVILLSAERVPGPYGVLRLRVREIGRAHV